MFLLLAAGCSFSATEPANVVEAIATPTAPPDEAPNIVEEQVVTPDPTPSPTFTPVALKEESPTVSAESEEEPKKPALFFFYADWCSACSEMRPVIEKLKAAYSDRIRFVMVNVDDPEARELVIMVGVRAIPLTIFVTSPDTEAQRWIGPRPESVLRAVFDEALK
jgi:thiol-disulfide isomerase/thioredoxin